MVDFRRKFGDRFGLQARMATSYVLVTAAAVILVEAIAVGFTIPNLLSNQDLISRVRYTAGTTADGVAVASQSATRVTLPSDFVLGEAGFSIGPGRVQIQGNGVVVPQITQSYAVDSRPLTIALAFLPDGRVLASSYPQRYAVGSQAYAVVPEGVKGIYSGSDGLISEAPTGQVAWAIQSVYLDFNNPANPKSGLGGKGGTPDAYVYVQAPVQPQTIASIASAAPLLLSGLVVLLLALPVGVVFGLLTTRGVVRRLRRLAVTTASFAEGDFAQRVSPGSSDEVGRLERNFNDMAERLEAAVSRERSLAEKSARLAERSRISRELHDSISQDLFSLSLLAGGLEKALPQDSSVRGEVRILAETVHSANREMRALLLELRPTTLEDKGLLAALEELTSTYAVRLGIKVESDLEPTPLAPAAELAVLRIAQEGLANAIKHAHATAIRLAMHRRDGFAEISISDNGRGFVASTNGSTQGLGLRLMRERVDELGGSLTIVSREGEGTVVTARLPVVPS